MATVKNYLGVDARHLNINCESAKTDRRLQGILIDLVLEANDFDVPAETVAEEFQTILTEAKCRMRYQSMSYEINEDFLNYDWNEKEEEFRNEAYKTVKTEILLQGIISSEKIFAAESELLDEACRIAHRQNISLEMVIDFMGKELTPIKNDLQIRKAIDLICSNAVYK